MEKIILQIWEESILDDSPILLGASLHINEEMCNNFINEKYKNRTNKTPKKYIRKIGNHTNCLVSKTLYSEILDKGGTIFIKDHQLHNLVMFNKLIEV
jgi:hypothetical protein